MTPPLDTRVDALMQALGVAAERSLLARSWRNVQRTTAAAEFTERVRLGGVLVITATVTHALLLTMVPAVAQPVAPSWLRPAVLIFALVLIVLARPIAHAWPGSRLRRLVGSSSEVGGQPRIPPHS